MAVGAGVAAATIIPGDDERMLAVNFLGIGIRLVLRVPFPVVLERGNLPIGGQDAAERRARQGMTTVRFT